MGRPFFRRDILLGSGRQTYSQKIDALFGTSIKGWWKQTEPVPTPVAGTGTIAQTLTAVLGVGTVFLSQIQIGDLLTGTGISGYVTAIADDTHLTLSSSTTVTATSFTYTRNISIDSSAEANNGLYRDVALAQTGIGDGLTSALYNGTTSVDNIYSAGLNTDFNNQEGSILAWGKVPVGVWTDATSRRLVSIAADASNGVNIRRTGTNNNITFTYIAGGVTSAVAIISLGGLITFWHVALTWSKSGDAVNAYAQGVQVGTTQTGLGVWAGALSSTLCAIGASGSAAGSPWSGNGAHVVLLNRPATAIEVLAAATVP